MNTTMILHVCLGLLLVGIPIGVLYLTDQKLMRSLAVSLVRMIGQLLVLSLLVWVLVKQDHWWLSLISIALLAFGWGGAMLYRDHQDLQQTLWPVGVAALVATLLTGLYLLVAVLPTERVMAARWMVPGMLLLLGHSLSMTIRGLTAYRQVLKSDEQQYEFLRGNGASHLKAVMPFVRRAVQAVLAPTAANLSATALYAMPLLLGGILIAGVQPINAFVVTIMMTIGCVASSTIALIVTLWLIDKKMFDSFGKLL